MMRINKVLQKYNYYLIYQKALSLSSSKIYEEEVERFLIFKGDDKLNQDLVIRYLKEKKSARNKAKIITILKSFSKFLEKEMNEKPFIEDLDSPKLEKHLPKYLEIHEIKRLFDQMDEDDLTSLRDKAFFFCIYSTGIRVSEATHLNVKNINFQKNTIKVIGKRDKQRIVLINDEAKNLILKYLKMRGGSNSILFLNKKGEMMSRENAHQRFQIYTKRIGFSKPIPVHSLRHSYATHLLRAGSDLLVVSQLLGHSDLRTTEIYTHLDISTLENSYKDIFKKIEADLYEK